MEDLLRMAHNATSSRILDVLFESPTVPFKAKRRFVVSLIGHYHTLVDDRIGSRVADRCWAFADPYLRVSLEWTVRDESHISYPIGENCPFSDSVRTVPRRVFLWEVLCPQSQFIFVTATTRRVESIAIKQQNQPNNVGSAEFAPTRPTTADLNSSFDDIGKAFEETWHVRG